MPKGRKGLLRRAALATVLASLLVGSLGLPALACYGGAAMGMGGAYTSLAEGVLAIYWNQAGLAFTPGRGEASMTSTTPEDMWNYNSFLGVAVKPTERLGLGFGQTKLAPWAGSETWNTVALGYRLSERWAVGGAFRYVEGIEPDYPYTAYASSGFDLSLQYRSGAVHLGLLVQDVGGPSETNSYWQNVRPSVSLHTDKLTLGFDVYDAEEIGRVVRNEPSIYLTHQVGLEYRPFGEEGTLALRGGFYHGSLMYGLGVRMGGAFVDVAFMPDPDYAAVQVTGGIRF